MKKPKLGELSEEEKARLRPPPPETLVDALQDSIHKTVGRTRLVKARRSKSMTNKSPYHQSRTLIRHLYLGIAPSDDDLAQTLDLDAKTIAAIREALEKLRSEEDDDGLSMQEIAESLGFESADDVIEYFQDKD